MSGDIVEVIEYKHGAGSCGREESSGVGRVPYALRASDWERICTPFLRSAFFLWGVVRIEGLRL